MTGRSPSILGKIATYCTNTGRKIQTEKRAIHSSNRWLRRFVFRDFMVIIHVHARLTHKQQRFIGQSLVA